MEPTTGSVLLGDNPGDFEPALTRAVLRYGLQDDRIVSDYWLIATMWAWSRTVGFGPVMRAYRDDSLSEEENIVGKNILFAGGTALTAAFGVAQRWSEDIDLVMNLGPNSNSRRFNTTCKSLYQRAGRGIGATYQITSKSPGHSFASYYKRGQYASRIDMTTALLDLSLLPPRVLKAYSLIGRISDPGMLERYPELGGFDVVCLDPNVTVMNKLLAQTQVSSEGRLNRIKERSRDVYDLACVALNRKKIGLLAGGDARRVLGFCESSNGPRRPGRPAAGFGSIAAFRPGTAEHAALADGYAAMSSSMVWGRQIPLADAIGLAASLDPGAGIQQASPGAAAGRRS